MAKVTAEFRVSALRRGIVVKTNKVTPTHTATLHAAAIEMANLGFIVAPSDLAGMSNEALNSMLKDARKIIGADRDMTPIYPGFPTQVEELSTMTLLVEQILHYWTGGSFLPDYPTIAREGLPLEDMLRNARSVKILSAGETARELIKSLVTSPIAISVDDRTLLAGAIDLQFPTLDLVSEIAKNSRNGENLQVFINLLNVSGKFSTNELLGAVVPATDNTDQLLRTVLTVASEASGDRWVDNYALAVNNLADRNSRAVKHVSISKASRRLLVNRLGELSNGFKADSLVGRQELWRGVMRSVHPFSLTLTDEATRAVNIIHGNVEYRTLNSLVEAAMADGDVVKVVELLSENQPGNLIRRLVAILRLVNSSKNAKVLADAVASAGSKSTLTTLVSAYNGVLSANDENQRVTRVAGLNNTLVTRKDIVKVDASHQKRVLKGLKSAIIEVLKKTDAPVAPVGISSDVPMPIVRRDAATTDRVLDRGQEIDLIGKGDTLRVFGHWNNNQRSSGYMDIGVAILDENFKQLAVSTWNSWSSERSWSTYSGDCLVQPGDHAAEYFDVNLVALRKKFPNAKWAAMTVQSWSGWPIDDVDFLAGAMLRSASEKGEVFDGRTVATAFKPTVKSTQAVPFAVNLDDDKIVWVDSSNGSTDSGVSSTNDNTIGALVYDEVARERLTMGKVAKWWAKAHDTATVDAATDRDQILALLG